MKLIEFDGPDGQPVLINPELVGAVLVSRDGGSTIRISGRAEDIHVTSDLKGVQEALREPVSIRGRIGR